MGLAGLTEYAVHPVFCFGAGTQNAVSGPLLTLYITFIPYGPRGNFKHVYDLSNDTTVNNSLVT